MAITFPNIDPVAIHLGPLAIHWYALAYLSGFLIGWWVAKYVCRLDQNKFRPNEDDIDDFMSWAILSILLGGRPQHAHSVRLRWAHLGRNLGLSSVIRAALLHQDDGAPF